MKWLKYFGAIVCVLLIIGTVPSVLLISKGLLAGGTSNWWYFFGKLSAYLVIIVVLIVISMKLIKSAKNIG
jgi:hypothetical protein